MIRNLLISIFFFFGPAILLFMLRNGLVLLRLWLRARQRREGEPRVIDITPVSDKKAPAWFYALVVVISLGCAVAVFMFLQSDVEVESRRYVPAHVGEDGKVVPGHWEPVAPK